ncbi:hypothetical protein Tco_0735142 [Tanacetum coccineum]
MNEGTQNYSLDHIFVETNSSVLIDKTKSARDGLKTAHTLTYTQDILSSLLTPQRLPIIVSDESGEEETKRYKDTHATSHDVPEDTSIPHPPFPKSVQIKELMAQSFGHEAPLHPTPLHKCRVLLRYNQTRYFYGPGGKNNFTNTYSATKEANLKNNLVDLMGIDVVEEYHKKKLLYDKYCDKMLKRRKNPKTTNCDVLTKKGPITLKVYREDWINEVISNFKVSDLHLAEWREFESLKKLQFYGYLEDQDHLHFSLCDDTETEDKTLARASVQLG